MRFERTVHRDLRGVFTSVWIVLGSSLLVWCSSGQVVMGGGATVDAVAAGVVGVEHVGQALQGGLGEVAAFAVLPLLVALAGRIRSGGVRTGCRGGPGVTSARRLISRLSRSTGLLDQILVQCSLGKAANAVRSGSASFSI